MWACCCCSAFSLKFPHGECVSQLSALPGPFHSSHSQLHSICLGGGTIAEREGDFLGVDVYVCVYARTSVHTWPLLPDYSSLAQNGSHLTLLILGRWPIKEAHH